MTENMIEGGNIVLARRLIESEIWRKPAEYLKIWIYILFKVNYKTTKNFQRGTGFFNFRQEQIPGVTLNQVYEFLRWAKSLNPTDLTTQITTQKTTRGIILKVNNYNKYQDLNNYCSQHRNQHRNQQTTNTITEIKEIKREIINNLSLSESEILKKYLLSRPRKEPIYDLDAYISELRKNKTLQNKLEKALKWHEKQTQKKLQAEKIPPPEKQIEDTPEERAKVLEMVRKKAEEIRKRI